MATKSIFRDSFGYGYSEEFPLLNISRTVGRTGKNLFDDVYLVQVLLAEILEQSSSPSSEYPTGIFTKATDKQLEAFKIFVKNKGGKCYFGGHIDPARLGTTAFGTSNTWAIVKLNEFLNAKLSESRIDQTPLAYLSKKYSQMSFIFNEDRKSPAVGREEIGQSEPNY